MNSVDKMFLKFDANSSQLYYIIINMFSKLIYTVLDSQV